MFSRRARIDLFRITATLALIAAACALASCGRNPGALPRSYPIQGLDELKAQAERSRPRCETLNPKALTVRSASVGIEKFAIDRPGRFRLERYEISGLVDRVDRSVPSFRFGVREFDADTGESPRLVVRADCSDLKGEDLALPLAPIAEIESAAGNVAAIQPFSISAAARGDLDIASRPRIPPPAPVPMPKVPEAAILLGREYVASVKPLRFQVKESAGGGLVVVGDFAGIDETLNRRVYRVRAVYSWESMP